MYYNGVNTTQKFETKYLFYSETDLIFLLQNMYSIVMRLVNCWCLRSGPSVT